MILKIYFLYKSKGGVLKDFNRFENLIQYNQYTYA